MKGTSASTGKPLSGIDHLRQSIRDILITPIGSRVMRREYGSRLYQLIDAPINRSILLEIYAATAEALIRWEPRFRLQKVVAASAAPGEIVLDMTGVYLPDGKMITLDGIEVR
jgi:hypothetical protein